MKCCSPAEPPNYLYTTHWWPMGKEEKTATLTVLSSLSLTSVPHLHTLADWNKSIYLPYTKYIKHNSSTKENQLITDYWLSRHLRIVSYHILSVMDRSASASASKKSDQPERQIIMEIKGQLCSSDSSDQRPSWQGATPSSIIDWQQEGAFTASAPHAHTPRQICHLCYDFYAVAKPTIAQMPLQCNFFQSQIK